MKKARLLKLLPQKADLARDLKAKSKLLTKLGDEVLDLEEILRELDGVEVHEGFPVAVQDVGDESFEVISAADDVARYAYVQPDGDGDAWKVRAYKSADDADGTSLAEAATRKAAEKAAKDFVATGRTGPPKAKAKAQAQAQAA